jgi:L-fucose isomerase-like protein
MGKAHTYAIKNLPFFYPSLPFEAELCGVCTKTPEKAEFAKETFGYKFATTNEDDLIYNDDIDIIDVSTPNIYHFETLIKAINAGKHIYCEKPLCISLDEALKIEKAAKEKGTVFGMVFNNRFIPAIMRAKQLIDERGYEAISLKDVDGMKKLCGFPPAPILMLLSDAAKVSTIPENDCLGNVTQLMVKYLTGQCAAYLEFYEFFTDRVLAGVPDFVPEEIVDGEVTVMPAAFGELSQGILNVSKVKPGELTMCRLFYTNGQYKLHMVKGEGISARRWEEAGWTQPAPQLPALEVMIADVEDFADKVAAQHYFIAYGDQTRRVKNLCGMLGIEVI